MTKEKSLKLIGYWAGNKDSHMDPYPHPSYLQDPKFWEEKGKYTEMKIIDYLDGGIECNIYRGLSPCRLCDELLGNCEKTDGVYIWPEMLSHYITMHNVILPDEFIEHAMKNMNETKEFNDEFWIEWSKKI